MVHFCRSACCNTLLCRVHMRQRRKTCDPWHVHGMYLPWTESLRSLAFSQGIPPKDGTVVLWRSCHIQTLQLFPLTNPTVVPAQLRPPCECLECRIFAKTLLFCRMLDTIPTNPTVVPCRLQTLQWAPRCCGLPEGAWSAE